MVRLPNPYPLSCSGRVLQPFFISGIDVRNRMSLMRLKGGKYLAYGLVMPTPDCVKKVR